MVIAWVAQNCFPMEANKIPTLERLLTVDEFAHVAAFPTVLRLLIHGPLLRELESSDTGG